MRAKRTLVATLALVLTTLAVQPATAVEPEFPVGFEGYHTYAEVDAELARVVADHGQGPGAIVTRRVLGQSYEGRDIWAIKISDNAATDEDEPESLAECGMHAREHLTVEMCLSMIGLLTDNYGAATALGERVTQIVNTTEIWIVPTLNPDGAAFDISGGVFHKWRKNRQPTPGTTKIGIDLNRNWGYRWGGAGSSGKPGSGQYRGRYPFEAVENVVLRDFILSRKIDGEQQIRTVFNWHSYGEFILRPYGYTKEDIPPDMTVDDFNSFVAMGRAMASRNGYRSRQGSDSYIYSGDLPAWVYGDQRIFVYTFEMYPPWGCDGCGGFYPPDELIARETTRNAEAVLYLLEQTECPYRAAGLGVTHCGPFNDDLEIDRGWTLSGGGAGSGQWERAVPALSRTGAGIKQKVRVKSGQAALVTGSADGLGIGADDLDGRTIAQSREFQLGSGPWKLGFSFTFAHDARSSTDDYIRISVVSGGVATPVWTLRGQALERNALWRDKAILLSGVAGKAIRLRVEAVDGGVNNLVEAVFENFRVYKAL